MNVGRNERCPCGSGKKFKYCCMAVQESVDYLRATRSETPPLEPSRTLASFVDLPNRLRVFVSNDVLLNQLFRDNPRIAEDFDKRFGVEIQKLNEVASQNTATLAAAVTHAPTESSLAEIHGMKMFLLVNAAQSTVAAIELIRRGFRLEPGVLVRTSLEQLSVVCHITIQPSDAAQVQAGGFSSTRTIASAKAVIPPFGRLYGLLSKYFIHVSRLHHANVNPIASYQDKDEGLEMNVRFVRSSLWMQLVVSELAFFDVLSSHRYFKKIVEGALAFAPSDKEREWMTSFLSLDEEFVPDRPQSG